MRKETLQKKGESEYKRERRLLSTQEAARYLGLSPRTLYNRTCRKAQRPFPVKPKRIGRVVRYDVRELDAYIASL